MTEDKRTLLQTFENPQTKRKYTIHITVPEFTCLCPRTGQPDFATFDIHYRPKDCCIELKSLKLYIHSFRQEGHFHEAVSNRISDDLVAICQPQLLRLEGRFHIRGGISTRVLVTYRAP